MPGPSKLATISPVQYFWIACSLAFFPRSLILCNQHLRLGFIYIRNSATMTSGLFVPFILNTWGTTQAVAVHVVQLVHHASWHFARNICPTSAHYRRVCPQLLVLVSSISFCTQALEHEPSHVRARCSRLVCYGMSEIDMKSSYAVIDTQCQTNRRPETWINFPKYNN